MEDQQQPEVDYKALFKSVQAKQQKLDDDLKTGLPEDKVRTDAMPDENWASAAPQNPQKKHRWTLEEEKLRVVEQNAQFYEDAEDQLAGFRQRYHSGKKDWTLKDTDMAQYNRENKEQGVDNRRGIE